MNTSTTFRPFEDFNMNSEEFDFLYRERATLKSFRSHYPDLKSCYADFASRVQERHSQPGQCCAECRSETRNAEYLALWRIRFQTSAQKKKDLGLGMATYILMLIGFHASTGSPQSYQDFTTHHRFCRGCHVRHLIGKSAFSMLGLILTLLFFAVIAASAALALFASINIVGKEAMDTQTWSHLGLSVLSSAILFPAIRFCRRRCVPAPLRLIAKPPVEFQGLLAARSSRG